MSEVLPEKQEGESDMKKQHHIDLLPGEVAQTVILSPDLEYAAQIAGQLANSKLTARKRQYATYNGEWNGVPVSVTSTGIGSPGLAIAVEELIMVGAKNLILFGTGSILQTWMPVPSLVISAAAVRGDGTSREYFPLEYPAVADWMTVEVMAETARRNSVQALTGYVRSNDALFAESIYAGKINYLKRSKPWIDAGCLATSSEAAALFTLAAVRGCRAGALIFALSSLKRPYTSTYLPSGTVEKAFSEAVRTTLDAASALASFNN